MSHIISNEDFEKLLDACGERPMLRLYVLTLGETGARCESEALYLPWEDVDLTGGFIWIARGRDGHRTKFRKGSLGDDEGPSDGGDEGPLRALPFCLVQRQANPLYFPRTTLGYAQLVKQQLKALVAPGNQANVPRNVPQVGVADVVTATAVQGVSA